MRSSTNQMPKLKQPAWLLRIMVERYCARYHLKGKLCQECEALLDFEQERTQSCTNCCGDTCCTRQCYPVVKRLQINHIIRWAEPKLRWRVPFIRFRRMLAKI